MRRALKTDEYSQQRTLDWYRERLGHWTGSAIADLMGKGRGGEMFGDTAKTYIFDVLHGRELSQAMVEDDDMFDTYLYQTNITNKAMEWGTMNEEDARGLYEKVTGQKVLLTGSVEHRVIEFYAASPDGVIPSEDKVIEIKCPAPKTYTKYRYTIHDGPSLKEVMPRYYWQVMAEMDCTEASSCDFVVYNPFMEKPLHIAHIERDDEAIETIHQRIADAEEFINQLKNEKK